MPRNAKVIINPKAGKSFIKLNFFKSLFGITSYAHQSYDLDHLKNKIKKELQSHQIDCNFYEMKMAGDAKLFAQSAQKEGYDLVIGVGGDGTLNEIIHGLVNQNLPLGIIPSGTANVLAHSLNIPFSIKKACALFSKHTPRAIDLGCINDHYFSCMCGLGFDAFIVKTTKRSFKKFFGPLAFVFNIFFKGIAYPFYSINIEIDGQHYQASSLVIHNSPYYGGSSIMAPHAKMNDGFLDVSLFKATSFFRFFVSLLNAKNKRKDPYFSQVQAKRIRILKQAQPAHVDAEYIGDAQHEIHIREKALLVF